MSRKLFCEICPFTYKISVLKCKAVRCIKDILSKDKIARKKSKVNLPVLIFEHSSVIRRELKGVDMTLQNNKAVNLSIAAPKVDGIIINPGEVFSFWKMVGSTNKRKGYREGLNILNSSITAEIGGGMCQFTNLIHWMILNTPFEIVEHHHHDGFDLFPDSGRRIPFGTGTSIAHNYLDYRFKNTSTTPIQLRIWVDDTHLHGEIRGVKGIDLRYEIEALDEHFERREDSVYRMGKVIRRTLSKEDNTLIKDEIIRQNCAKVLYDTSHLEIK